MSNKYDPRKPNTAKSQRERISVKPAPALIDPVQTLGHPPRGRTGRGVGNRVSR